jgi:hypothetical protein
VDSDYVLGVRLRDLRGNYVLSAQHLEGIQRIQLPAGGYAYGSVTLRLPVTHGDYVLRTGIFGFRDGEARDTGRYDFSRAVFWDVREDAMIIRVRPYAPMPLAGPVHQHAMTRLVAVGHTSG